MCVRVLGWVWNGGCGAWWFSAPVAAQAPASPGWRRTRRFLPPLCCLARGSCLPADRMVQQGHYGELSSILGAIPTNQQLATADAPEAEDEPEQKEPVKKLGAEEEEEEEEGEEIAAEGENDDDDEEEEEGAEEEEEEEEAGRQQGGAPAAAPQQQDGEGHAGRRDAQQRPRARRMQTFVFSATLTLPANLRKRLRKGGGGASGSSDLDSLMDKIPFR